MLSSQKDSIVSFQNERSFAVSKLPAILLSFTIALLGFSAPVGAQTAEELRLYKKYGITLNPTPQKIKRNKKDQGDSAHSGHRAMKNNDKRLNSDEIQGRAANELTVPSENQSTHPGVSAATVKLQGTNLEDPNVYPTFQVGVSIQQYQPIGTGQVVGLDPYDLAVVGSQPMFGLDLRYLPFESSLGSSAPNLASGFYGNVGYSEHQLSLKSPIGTAIEDATLHTTRVEAGLATRYRFARIPKLSLLPMAGIGWIDSIQSAGNALANHSSSAAYMGLGLQVEYQLLTRWSVFGGYAYRTTLSRHQDIGIQPHNLALGILGSFQ